MEKVVQVNFRTASERRDKLRSLADAAGATVGEYLAALIDAAAEGGDERGRAHRRCLRMALRYAAAERMRSNARNRCFWSYVMEIFGLGSTSASELCAEFGFDPETGEEAAG